MTTEPNFDELLKRGRDGLHAHIDDVHTNLLGFLEAAVKHNLNVRTAMESVVTIGVKEAMMGISARKDVGAIIENLGWIAKALVYSTIPDNISWEAFVGQFSDGLQTEADLQHKLADDPRAAARIVEHVIQSDMQKKRPV